jgi:hypothetical protein
MYDKLKNSSGINTLAYFVEASVMKKKFYKIDTWCMSNLRDSRFILKNFVFKKQLLEQIYSFYSKKSVWQGFSNDLFSFKLFQVIYKSYRQVLTPSQISRLLLKTGFLDKFRLAYNLKQHIQDYTRYN